MQDTFVKITDWSKSVSLEKVNRIITKPQNSPKNLRFVVSPKFLAWQERHRTFCLTAKASYHPSLGLNPRPCPTLIHAMLNRNQFTVFFYLIYILVNIKSLLWLLTSDPFQNSTPWWQGFMDRWTNGLGDFCTLPIYDRSISISSGQNQTKCLTLFFMFVIRL